MDRRDRRGWLTILGAYAFGFGCLGFGVWGLLTALPEVKTVFGCGVVGGAIVVGSATLEFARRVRRGPQEPGRHTRE